MNPETQSGKDPQYMAVVKRHWLRVCLCLVLQGVASNVLGFSLLGPYTTWMDTTNGYRQPGDIGGPMDITEAYRWNVPLVTYGFDRSFLEYFGSNGVAAVEAAIQVWNDLPPASELVPTNFPLSTRRKNWQAESEGLFDLKTLTLNTIAEQLGLGQSMHSVFALRQWRPDFEAYPYFDETSTWLFPNYVVRRNFDPQSILPDDYVNGVLFGGHFFSVTSPPTHFVFSQAVDAEYDLVQQPLADSIPDPGAFATNLTCDDAGAIRFLLSSTNVVYETLLPDVRGGGPNANSYVDGTWRCGVEKITFVRHPYDSLSGTFSPFTNVFVDAYFTNGTRVQQQLERVTGQPDFLFCADNHGREDFYDRTIVARTGTSNWFNNAQQNGQPGGAGPGSIRPQVRIAFQKLGLFVATYETGSDPVVQSWVEGWGSFDVSTNAPVSYPDAQSGQFLQTGVNLEMRDAPRTALIAKYTWLFDLAQNQAAALQTSTNLLNWTTCAVVTNKGTVTSWVHYGVGIQKRFFRVVGDGAL